MFDVMKFDSEIKKKKLKLEELPEYFEVEEVESGDPAYCLHCEEEISMQDVLDNEEGDYCPNHESCGGAGWGVDIFLDEWWLEP